MRPGRGARAFWFAMSASLIATMNRTEDIADFPEKERDSYEALQGIHSLMDDDRDGSVDRQESHEFLREDLQCSDPSARHSSFHREDSAVSFAEMWDAWRASEVYKWTSDDVLRWVEETVELPQYLELFRDHNISGPHLPQLAASNQTLLTGLLHITDRSHRHKLQLKALDVVLFGPPPATHSPVKDAILVAAVVAGLGAGWVAFLQSKRWRRHVQRMELELESLQQAEESLIELQNKLTQAEEEQRNVESEKRSLESRLRTRFERMRAAGGGSENKELGADADEKYKGGECGADQLRALLHRAEKELAMLRESSITTPALRPWLQLTYELEEEQGVLQRKLAEQRLFSARELADRIRRKQHSVLGSFFVAHSVSLDLVDNQILETKQCLAELMSCLRERATRWQEIERLCGFSITQNPGKTALRSMLYDNDESNLHFFSPSSFLAEPQLEAVEHEERGFSLSFPTSTQQYTTTTGDLHATRDSGRNLAGDAGWEYQSSDSCDSIGTMVTDTSACDGGGGSEMSESPKKHDRGLRFTSKSDGKSTERLIQSASDFPRLKTGRLSPLYVRSTRSLQNITSCQDFSQKDTAFLASTTTQSEEEIPFEESDTTEVDIVQCDSSESLKTRDGSAAGFRAKREPGHKFARKEDMRGQKSKLARMFKKKYF